MYAPRGSNASQCVGEEIGAEGPDGFDMETFEKDILPTVRLERKVNQKSDKTHIDFQHSYITNASTKQNRAYSVHRYNALKAMLFGERHEGFVADIPWEVAVLCNIRAIGYIKAQRSKLSTEDFLREMCARYTGSNENPIVTDEVLSRCRKIMAMEDMHCGDNDVTYIVSHDVSYEDGTRNAKCADVVLKLTKYKSEAKRDKYRKQVVYADSYPPPKTAYAQARKLKSLWLKYCMDGTNTTYLVVDAQAYGREVVEELMKPSIDGTPNLCCYKHMKYQELEQPNALPVIYPLKAGTTGTVDAEGAMLQYAQVEFQQGNIELLTSIIADGVEQYKRRHNIKDSMGEARIAAPYRKTDELCQQIQNLVLKTGGATLKEERKSKSIQRDIWSALKYALRMAKLLEESLIKATYRKKSSWDAELAKFRNAGHGVGVPHNSGTDSNIRANIGEMRSKLLSLRRR